MGDKMSILTSIWDFVSKPVEPSAWGGDTPSLLNPAVWSQTSATQLGYTKTGLGKSTGIVQPPQTNQALGGVIVLAAIGYLLYKQFN